MDPPVHVIDIAWYALGRGIVDRDNLRVIAGGRISGRAKSCRSPRPSMSEIRQVTMPMAFRKGDAVLSGELLRGLQQARWHIIGGEPVGQPSLSPSSPTETPPECDPPPQLSQARAPWLSSPLRAWSGIRCPSQDVGDKARFAPSGQSAYPPCGQRCVTFLVRVKKRMLSSPYWFRSPKAEFFQPPCQPALAGEN